MTEREAIWTLAKLAFIIIASWFAISGGSAKGRADDAIWSADRSYAAIPRIIGVTTQSGESNGAYKGHIDKDWVNPYVPKIDRGQNETSASTYSYPGCASPPAERMAPSLPHLRRSALPLHL